MTKTRVTTLELGLDYATLILKLTRNLKVAYKFIQVMLNAISFAYHLRSFYNFWVELFNEDRDENESTLHVS